MGDNADSRHVDDSKAGTNTSASDVPKPVVTSAPRRHRALAAIAVLLLCVTSISIVATVTLKRRLDRERFAIRDLQHQIDAMIEAHQASGLQVYPNTALMEDAFTKGDFERATRLAENLVFAYPSDAPSFEKLLSAYESALRECLSTHKTLDACRLLTWMAGIQDRQAMVIKSAKVMDLYLSGLIRGEVLRRDVITNANTQIESLRQEIRNAAGDWNNATYDAMDADAAGLVLVGSMLDQSQLVLQANDAADIIELLRIPVPNESATPDELIDYLGSMDTGNIEDPSVAEARHALLAPRMEPVSRILAKSLEAQTQSPEGMAWAWRRLDEIHFAVDYAADGALTHALQRMETALKTDSENQIRAAIDSYRQNSLTEEDLRNLILTHTRQLERVDSAGVSVMSLVKEQQQAQAERHENRIAEQIGEFAQRLKKGDADPDRMLAELTLLAQPTRTETMLALIRLSQSLQRVVAERDHQRSTLRVKAYNRGALSVLNGLMVRMNNATRNDRLQTRVEAAKELATINEAFLTKGMRDRYAEVYAEAMKGLDDAQKLKVYDYWVNAKPRELESINE